MPGPEHFQISPNGDVTPGGGNPNLLPQEFQYPGNQQTAPTSGDGNNGPVTGIGHPYEPTTAPYGFQPGQPGYGGGQQPGQPGYGGQQPGQPGDGGQQPNPQYGPSPDTQPPALGAPAPAAPDLGEQQADYTAGTSSPGWWIDRGIAAASVPFYAAKITPALESKLTEANKLPDWRVFKNVPEEWQKWPNYSSLKNVGRDEWMSAFRTDPSKAMIGTFIGDTALDLTLFRNKQTSWKTIAADIGGTVLSATLAPEYGLAKAIAAGIAPHVLEKWLMEPSQDKP